MLTKINNSVKLAACYPTKLKSAARPRPASDTQLIRNDGKLLNKLPLKAEDQNPAKLICDLTTKQIKKSGIKSTQTQNSASEKTLLEESDTLPIPNSGKRRSIILTTETNETKKIISSELHSELSSTIMNECSMNKIINATSVENHTKRSGADDSLSIIATKAGLSEDSYAKTVTMDSDTSKMIQRSYLQPSATSEKRKTESWILWCNLNDEQEALEKIFGDECVSVYGTLPPEEKVARIWSFINGDKRILISKPTICGFGLNFQFCHKVIFVGLTDSFEATYQAIRRVWRFGQSERVEVYFIHADIEGNVVDNLKRKERDFEDMLDQMSVHMIDIMKANVQGAVKKTETYDPQIEMELPEWLLEDQQDLMPSK